MHFTTETTGSPYEYLILESFPADVSGIYNFTIAIQKGGIKWNSIRMKQEENDVNYMTNSYI